MWWFLALLIPSAIIGAAKISSDNEKKAVSQRKAASFVGLAEARAILLARLAYAIFPDQIAYAAFGSKPSVERELAANSFFNQLNKFALANLVLRPETGASTVFALRRESWPDTSGTDAATYINQAFTAKGLARPFQ